MKFSIKDFLSKGYQICKFLADLVTFTEEILSGKLYFFVQWYFFVVSENMLQRHGQQSYRTILKVNNKDIVPLLLTVNRFHRLFWCFQPHKMVKHT